MGKKIVALVLTLLIICSSCIVAVYANASHKTVDANTIMFENVLENRPWVIESLVNGKFENNPYTMAIYNASEVSMMTDVLTNYKTDEAFKYLVDTMETVDNAGNYVGMEIEKLLAVFTYWFGMINDEQLITYVDETIKSVNDLQYESILNDVLQTDYTSSWGSTLFESNSSLEQYRQMSKTLSAIADYQKMLKANSDILLMESFKDSDAFIDYTDKFLDAYSDKLYEALNSKVNSEFIADNEALTKHMINAFSTAFVMAAEMQIPEFRSDAEEDALLSSLFVMHFSPEINSILKGAGKVLNIGTEALKYAQLLEALVSQNNTTVQVMQRMRSHTSDNDLSTTLKLYSDLVADQSNDQALAYDIIVDYVNNKKTSWIGDKAIKGAGKFFDNLLTLKDGYFDADLQIMTNATSQNLVKLGKCVNLGIWLADKATNIKDTAKEIYVCKYTNKILTAAKNTYKADYQAYLANKTDENAKKCIDDLEYIKKLRLYGETHAYKSICSQTESVIGLLLGSSSIQEDIDKRYQANIDSLLGCTILPQSNIDFTVGKGETLTLSPLSLNNGKKTLRATLKKADGTTITFPEAENILKSWMTVNDGTVILLSNSHGSSNIFIPAIKCTGTSLIEIYGSMLYIGKLQNSGTLTVDFKTDTAKMTVADAMTNSGTITFNGNGNTAEAYITSNSNTINLNNATLNITGNLQNIGTISGNVIVTSDGTNPYYSNTYIENPIPTVSGTGKMTDLTFASNYKKGIRIDGEQCISASLASGNTRLRTSENLILTGSCAADKSTLDGNITFRDYTSPSALTVDGTAYIENDVVFNHNVVFNDGLCLTSSCKSFTVNSRTDVKGDMEYKAGKINGADWLILHGDLNITASSPNISKLDFEGTLPQTVSSSGTLTVSELNNHNASLNGVTFNSPVHVTGVLQSGNTSAYANGKNVVLTGDAKLNGNTIRGSISAKDWNISDSMTVNGTLFTSGTITLKDGKTLDTLGYDQSGGTLAIENNSSLNVKGDALFGGAVTNNGSVSLGGDSKITASFTGGTLTVKGDLDVSAALKPDTLVFSSKTAQNFTNTAETSVTNLTIDNTSLAGITLNSVINVSENYNNPSSKVMGGRNIIIGTGDGNISIDEASGDISVSGTYTVPEGETVVIKGSMYLQSNAKLIVSDGATLQIRNNLIAEKAEITVSENALLQIDDYYTSSSGTLDISGDMLIKGDAQFSSDTVTASGLITVKGDCNISGGTWNEPNIKFESKTIQTLTVSSEVTVNNLTLDNSSFTGFTVNGTVRVKGTYTNNCKKITGGEKIILAGSAGYVSDGETQGSFSVDGTFTVETGKTLTVNGNLNLSSGAVVTVQKDAVLKVRRSIISSGATINVEQGGEIIVEDYLSSSSDTFNISGEMLIKGDAKISSSTVNAAGLITFKGDLNVSSGTWNSPNVSFDSKLPQNVSGSAFNTGDLTINNQCKTGITFNVNVTYSGTLDTASSVITGIEKLTAKS